MFEIMLKKALNSQVKMMDIYAPMVAHKALPGQFIILRTHTDGERMPLTIAGCDRKGGTVRIIFQEVGKTSKQLGAMERGQVLSDFVGPLGHPSPIKGYKRACVIAGGLGVAISYPLAKGLHRQGSSVDVICGFRNKELIILEEEFSSCSDNMYVTTDDGSNGTKGFVSDTLKKLLDSGEKYDVVIAIGPMIMMKVIADITREYGIKTLVSMNPIMVDGTGMCGACRVTVAGKTKFACVDGPDFDAHEIDFEEALQRLALYKPEEKLSNERHHVCKIGLGGGSNG